MTQLTKDQRRQKRHDLAAIVRKQLVERFPACFQPHGAPKLPLKIGVHQDIRSAVPGMFSRYQLNVALHDYTSGASYRAALVEGADRIDLDGNPAGKVEKWQEEKAPLTIAADALRVISGPIHLGNEKGVDYEGIAREAVRRQQVAAAALAKIEPDAEVA